MNAISSFSYSINNSKVLNSQSIGQLASLIKKEEREVDVEESSHNKDKELKQSSLLLIKNQEGNQSISSMPHPPQRDSNINVSLAKNIAEVQVQKPQKITPTSQVIQIIEKKT
mmetsp:Transcript_6645/g.6895  ORF Transcript_6645/g.6895 Transcript_6645/m.6895 type:complete len:113 (-) Transcript_6645:6-344(-)